MTIEAPPKESTWQKLSNLSNLQTLTDYLNTSFTLGFVQGERIRFYTALFLLTALSVVALHLLFSESQPYVELAVHAILIGVGYCLGMGLFELALRVLVGKWKKTSSLKVGSVWGISLGGFILGFLLLAPLRDYFTHLHPMQKERLPFEWFVRMIPIWGLFTYLFIQQQLKTTLAAEHKQLLEVNEVLKKRLDGVPKSGESIATSVPFVVHVDRETMSIEASYISHITVEEHYCTVYFLEKETIRRFEVKLSLKDALKKLPEKIFIQIHRSHVANLIHVQRVHKIGRSCELIMKHSDLALPVSRNRLSEVLDRLKETLK